MAPPLSASIVINSSFSRICLIARISPFVRFGLMGFLFALLIHRNISPLTWFAKSSSSLYNPFSMPHTISTIGRYLGVTENFIPFIKACISSGVVSKFDRLMTLLFTGLLLSLFSGMMVRGVRLLLIVDL
uniref:Uncharacterized protein n=1 Tax=Cacopsylla melanoneura TaxID=428564 RepID=A0A8D8QV87_9HEMI